MTQLPPDSPGTSPAAPGEWPAPQAWPAPPAWDARESGAESGEAKESAPTEPIAAEAAQGEPESPASDETGSRPESGQGWAAPGGWTPPGGRPPAPNPSAQLPGPAGSGPVPGWPVSGGGPVGGGPVGGGPVSGGSWQQQAPSPPGPYPPPIRPPSPNQINQPGHMPVQATVPQQWRPGVRPINYPAPVRFEGVPGEAFALAILPAPKLLSGISVGALLAGIGSILVSLAVWLFGLNGAEGGWGALVAGAFFVLAALLGAAGMVLGMLGLRSIKRDQARGATGRGFAITGIACGGFGLLSAISGLALALVLQGS